MVHLLLVAAFLLDGEELTENDEVCKLKPMLSVSHFSPGHDEAQPEMHEDDEQSNGTGTGNPHGLRVRVPTGTGTGMDLATRAKPVPVPVPVAGLSIFAVVEIPFMEHFIHFRNSRNDNDNFPTQRHKPIAQAAPRARPQQQQQFGADKAHSFSTSLHEARATPKPKTVHLPELDEDGEDGARPTPTPTPVPFLSPIPAPRSKTKTKPALTGEDSLVTSVRSVSDPRTRRNKPRKKRFTLDQELRIAESRSLNINQSNDEIGMRGNQGNREGEDDKGSRDDNQIDARASHARRAQIQPVLTSFDEQLPMGSLPFPPKNSAPFFRPSQSPQDLIVLESPPYVHSTSFKTTSSRDEWEDLPGHASPTVPSQAYMLSAEVSPQAQAPFSSKTPHSPHPYLKCT
ncbi:hypothetical protein BU15DRAFT_66931 [Melanogaster broomeanus]|nr:hypothetical protein BU15DRAFT_66931 [Melanogaster broomeanus]